MSVLSHVTIVPGSLPPGKMPGGPAVRPAFMSSPGRIEAYDLVILRWDSIDSRDLPTESRLVAFRTSATTKRSTNECLSPSVG